MSPIKTTAFKTVHVVILTIVIIASGIYGFINNDKKIDSTVVAHNDSSQAHPDIRNEIEKNATAIEQNKESIQMVGSKVDSMRIEQRILNDRILRSIQKLTEEIKNGHP